VSARCAIHLASSRRLFWQVRVTQGSMARCAVRSRPTGFLSGIGASRGLIWRGAQMGFSKSVCITVTCALRRAYGAARGLSF
ncbi:hypothetical protein A2U01_0060747, partial [Trifolium medium]|nr:hypothetical protein [Trifolium medium]